jgi:lipopolysaccharide/colanic/teichoic acid biosynthesis glycosyltransferase
LDILLGLAGLLISAILFLAIAPLVKLTSRGPIFYSQIRVGRFGVPFHIYKFRTMQADAEKNGAQWAKTNDARVTRLGKILRKTRLDETPQFFNILLGQMSFVGPRPERPEFEAQLEKELPFYTVRHLVRPGLTGWAQINYRYAASALDAKRKLQFDLYYVRHHSLALDLFIILRTIIVIGKGAR